MVDLLRLIVAAFVAVFSLASQAAIPTVPGWRATFNGTTFALFPSKSDSCLDSALQSAVNANAVSLGWASGTTFVEDSPSGYCRSKSVAKTTGAVQLGGYVSIGGGANVCPANSTLSGSSCVCTSPFVEDSMHTSCVPPPDPCLALKGALYGEIEWASTTKGNNYSCLGGEGQLASCQTVAVCDYTTQVPGQVGYTCRGNAYATGGRASSCVGTGESADGPSPAPVKDPLNPDKLPSPGQPAPARCPAGQAPGDFNGTRICVPTGSGTESSTPAPGNGSSTVNNSDGSSTTSTQSGRTTCLNGQCTTITNNTNTTVNAAGNTTCPAGQTSGTTTVDGQSRTTCTGTTSATGTQAQSEFCTANPKDKQCDGDGADTSFGGSCASGFKAVSDDAVLNAMAEEQHKRNCETLRTDAEPSTWAAAEGQKTDNAMKDNPNNSTVNIGPGNFDMGDSLGGGGCSLNKTVVVRGYSVALPFNVLCDPLAVLGQILVAVSLLLAARILTRG